MQNHWNMQQLAAIQYAAMAMQNYHMAPLAATAAMVPPASSQVNVEDDNSDDEKLDEEKRTLFCANLDDRVTEELLYELFLHAGPIESVRIPKDNQGKNRCYGFITYIHDCTPPYAMQIFKGLTLFRKQIVIKFQGSSNPPLLPRPSAPVRVVRQEHNANHSDRTPQNRFDNSALRSSNFPASTVTAVPNPFRQDSSSWMSGSAHRNTPYKREDKTTPSSSRQRNADTTYSRDESRRSRTDRGSNQRKRDRSREGRRYYCDNRRR